MKKSNICISIAGVLIIIAVGYYLIAEEKTIETDCYDRQYSKINELTCTKETIEHEWIIVACSLLAIVFGFAMLYYTFKEKKGN